MTDITPGQPSWVELITTDGDKAKAFYGGLLGWRFNDGGPEFGGYQIVTLADGETVVGGGMVKDTTRMGDVPDSFCLYLATPDIKAADARIREHGGQVLVEPMQVAEEGWMAFYADPTGAPVGSWQPGSTTSIEPGDKHGQPVWFELMTTDYDTAVAFYRDAYAWDPHPMEGMRYATLGEYDGSKAGIGDGTEWPGGEQSHWQVYFSVDDTDAACAKVAELGGHVLAEPQDTPHGRIATVVDDQGAMFLLVH